MKTLTKLSLILAFSALSAHAQLHSLIRTTLSAAIPVLVAPPPTVTTVTLASCTSIVAPSPASGQGNMLLYVDHEAMQVIAIPTTSPCRVTVGRGAAGTPATGHAANSLVWAGNGDWFSGVTQGISPQGTCTLSQIYAHPRIHLSDGTWYICDSLGLWGYAGPGPDSATTRTAITTVADAAYTALPFDNEIDYTSITATRLVTLPAATLVPGKTYVIKDSGGNATSMIVIQLATVDGSATFSCVAAAYGSCQVRSNGTTWGQITK